MDHEWSIPVLNLSTEDIRLKQELLRTSSPKNSSSNSNSNASDSQSISSIEQADQTDNEKTDPTYGVQRKSRVSMRPGQQPSAACITVQK